MVKVKLFQEKNYMRNYFFYKIGVEFVVNVLLPIPAALTEEGSLLPNGKLMKTIPNVMTLWKAITS